MMVSIFQWGIMTCDGSQILELVLGGLGED